MASSFAAPVAGVESASLELTQRNYEQRPTRGIVEFECWTKDITRGLIWEEVDATPHSDADA